VAYEAELVKESPEKIWVSINIRSIADRHGAIRFYEGSALDITPVKNHQRALEYQATHDLLTMLPNRVLLNDRLDQALGKAIRRGGEVAVAFVDLDNFKSINDSFGHKVGDIVLSETAGRLLTAVRDSDTVARVGGDEFVLVIEDADGANEFSSLMTRLLPAVAAPIQSDGVAVSVTCSVGISRFPHDGRRADELIKHADIAMYRAKQSGRNTVEFYNEGLHTARTSRIRMEMGLKNAISNNELSLVYQPQINMWSRRVCRCEALLRWNNPELGNPPPSEFIPVAEETGLIIAIGEWVIRTALKQLYEWHQSGFSELCISINLSARQLRDPSLIPAVEFALANYSINPAHIEFELTETMLMDGVEKIGSALAALRQLGVRLSIDDFGTGYSSLSYLRSLPVDAIKIDKSFIWSLSDSDDNGLIVRTMIALAIGLRLQVIAEGVETQDQLDFLLANGVDAVQGFIFSAPLPPEAFERLLLLGRQLSNVTAPWPALAANA
jgi:diguanylate cyclase (GGDEF)-like protein